METERIRVNVLLAGREIYLEHHAGHLDHVSDSLQC